MTDSRGYVQLDLVRQVKPNVRCIEDRRIPLLQLDPPAPQRIGHGKGQVAHLHVLVDGELDGVAANCYPFHLLQVDVQHLHEPVGGVNQQSVGQSSVHLDAECQVIHDVRAWNRMTHSYCSGDDLIGLQVHRVHSRTARSNIYG